MDGSVNLTKSSCPSMSAYNYELVSTEFCVFQVSYYFVHLTFVNVVAVHSCLGPLYSQEARKELLLLQFSH